MIDQAASAGIRIGWTNPCIEEWFSAYFGAMPAYDGSVSCCDGFSQTFERKTRQKYVKSDPDIYEKLTRFGDENAAIHIAALKMQEHLLNGKNRPSQQSPGTTVHRLVEEIKAKVR